MTPHAAALAHIRCTAAVVRNGHHEPCHEPAPYIGDDAAPACRRHAARDLPALVHNRPDVLDIGHAGMMRALAVSAS